ncbi:CadD family cadmium resistance transporter [Streptococcus moroccensis]|uniref:Cadmium resistance transport/sequestration family protein n=1 Tax=Streptococcus moroccensis TaxID=1451356 RepID=A0ABT9YQP0_9STRE|nr:CadD family cadmium resistance transporter [Streptococcus moroccensis]MDQ0222312.1 cadmium resistance transport/sequestration family protein [Streptococcus moroccensis]
MFQTLVTSFFLYAATAVDLLIILMIFFAKAKSKREISHIYLGQYLGSGILILASLFFAFVLQYVPEERFLGFLGVIPIFLGLKILFLGEGNGEEMAEESLEKQGLSKLIPTIAFITIVSCGADNIGLFVPYFLTLTTAELVLTLIVFAVAIFVLVKLAQSLVSLPGIGERIEKHSRWIIALVYILLGIGILVETEALSLVLSWFR